MAQLSGQKTPLYLALGAICSILTLRESLSPQLLLYTPKVLALGREEMEAGSGSGGWGGLWWGGGGGRDVVLPGAWSQSNGVAIEYQRGFQWGAN